MDFLRSAGSQEDASSPAPFLSPPLVSREDSESLLSPSIEPGEDNRKRRESDSAETLSYMEGLLELEGRRAAAEPPRPPWRPKPRPGRVRGLVADCDAPALAMVQVLSIRDFSEVEGAFSRQKKRVSLRISLYNL